MTGLVNQARDPCPEKPLDPLVDIAAAESDRAGNLGNRHPIGEEEDDPPSAALPCWNGSLPLPRQQRLPVRQCEVDPERGFPSLYHPVPLLRIVRFAPHAPREGKFHASVCGLTSALGWGDRKCAAVGTERLVARYGTATRGGEGRSHVWCALPGLWRERHGVQTMRRALRWILAPCKHQCKWLHVSLNL